jgi:MerR family transcriptional regulator/heat shock protein HspR
MSNAGGIILYNVTTTAKMTGVHAQTLRHYEKIGLVVPRRTLGGTRRYSTYDIEKLQTVRELASGGVNLEGIGVIIRQREEINILRRQLAARSEGAVFSASESGLVSVEQLSRMSLIDRVRLMRRLRKQEMMRLLEKKPLEIGF